MATWILKDYRGYFEIDGVTHSWDMKQWGSRRISDPDEKAEFEADMIEADTYPDELIATNKLVIEPITEDVVIDGVTMQRQIGRKHYFFDRTSAWEVHPKHLKWEARMKADEYFVSMPASENYDLADE